MIATLRRIASRLGLSELPGAITTVPSSPPSIIREHRENEEARVLRRFSVEAGPLAFMDHCEMLAAERSGDAMGDDAIPWALEEDDAAWMLKGERPANAVEVDDEDSALDARPAPGVESPRQEG